MDRQALVMIMVRVSFCEMNAGLCNVPKSGQKTSTVYVCVSVWSYFFVLQRKRGSELFSLNNEGDYCHSSVSFPSFLLYPLWVFLLSPLGLVTVALNWFSHLVSACWGMTASACPLCLLDLNLMATKQHLAQTRLSRQKERERQVFLFMEHCRDTRVERGFGDSLTDNMLRRPT